MERRNRVDELYALTLRANGVDRLTKGRGNESVVVHRYVHDFAFIGTEDAERADVGGRFDEHYVTGIAERTRHQIQRHLRSGCDDDVVRVSAHTNLGRDVEDLLAQPNVTLTRSVLQRLRSVLTNHARCDVGHLIHRECLDVGHSAGEGDHLGAARDREECANRRPGDVLGSLGVGIDPWVEAGTGG